MANPTGDCQLPTASQSEEQPVDPVLHGLRMIKETLSKNAVPVSRRRHSRTTIKGDPKRGIRRCIVPQCPSIASSNSHPPRRFHAFPRVVSVCELWKRLINNARLASVPAEQLSAKRRCYVCSEHFEDSCYQYPSLRNDVNTRLRWNALPTILPRCSDAPPAADWLPLYSGGADSVVIGGGSCARDLPRDLPSSNGPAELVTPQIPVEAAHSQAAASINLLPPSHQTRIRLFLQSPTAPTPPPSSLILPADLLAAAAATEQLQVDLLHQLGQLRAQQRRQRARLAGLARQLAAFT